MKALSKRDIANAIARALLIERLHLMRPLRCVGVISERSSDDQLIDGQHLTLREIQSIVRERGYGEFDLMIELRALELSEVWRSLWTGKFDGYLKHIVLVSPSRYRRWVEAHAGYPLVSTAIMDRVARLSV